MEEFGVIYLITNKINNKQYVGQAINISSNGRIWGSKRRWQKHVSMARNNKCECYVLENAIRKYDSANFIVEDIIECPIDELNINETKYINYYNTLAPNGYNLMTGGSNGRKHSEITRTKMSQTRIGKKHSEETKKKISASHKKYTKTKEHKMNIGRSGKYRNMSAPNKIKLQTACNNINIEQLPMYIYYSIDKRNNRNVDVITVKIPKYNKKFCSKSISIEDKIRLAIEYKTTLIHNGHWSEGSPQSQ